MKHVCITMHREEIVLPSYLVRVFEGELVLKKKEQTVRFPEGNTVRPGQDWTARRIKSFCQSLAVNKKALSFYKAKIAQRRKQT